MNGYVNREPELEIVEGQSSSLRYLEHGAESELIRWHCHSEYELHLIVATHGKAFVGDYIGNFEPGHLCLVGPNLPHNWVSSEHSISPSSSSIRDKVINFSQSTFDVLYEVMPESRELTALLERSSHGIEFNRKNSSLYEAMFDAVRNTRGLERLIKFFELLHFLMKDDSCQQLSSKSFALTQPSDNIDLINKALAYIGEKYTQPLSLEAVSRHVGMSSPSSFSRFFHKATGMKYIEFIKKLRISKACEKLERTDEPITSICFAIGFANVANFNRHFMSIKGMTPRKYRALAQKKYTSSL
ncbi:MAG: helix-turn-helix domain-containing protein [Arenicella sp.]